jgi:hypothetical protein
MNHRWEFATKLAHVSFAREAKQSIARKLTGLFRRCGDDDARRSTLRVNRRSAFRFGQLIVPAFWCGKSVKGFAGLD